MTRILDRDAMFLFTDKDRKFVVPITVLLECLDVAVEKLEIPALEAWTSGLDEESETDV